MRKSVLSFLKMEKIKRISIKDKKYPRLLKEIKNPPKILYIKGEFSESPCFAIVGTRRCSPYGKQATLEIAGNLNEAGLTIVSGMAKGIDSFAHKACLEKGGKTIAVLGTGIDERSIYPQENLRLAREIIKNKGMLISEFPPGTPGYPSNFPQRNRIISGLSLGVLVVEAKQKSGSLITARYATLQNRKLFAVPGNIYSLNSKGSHQLIKKGAKLVDGVNDILKELNLPPKERGQKLKGETKSEQLILNTLREEASHIDKIIKRTKLSPAQTASSLAILEIKSKVKNLGGNIYTLMR